MADPRAERPHFLLFGQKVDAAALAPGLHLVATPIGNLADISLRALATLAAADLVLAEDTRTSQRLLGHYGVRTQCLPYHEHNAAQMRPKVLQRLGESAAVALVSDAGTPLISDPGYKLAVEAGEAGHKVYAVPGASAVLAALCVSGLPTDRFFFEGFLPPKAAARRARLSELASTHATLVLFESPRRLAGMLADAAAMLGDRPATVTRELTKLHEEAARGTLSSLAERYAQDEPRGEIVVVIGPPSEGAASVPADDIEAALREALADHSLKEAVARVAAASGQPRRTVYARALELTRER